MRILTRLAALILLFTSICFAQTASFPAQPFTATGQTGTAIRLTGGVTNGFATGTVQITGAITTVTFAVRGSIDGGVTWFAIPTAPVATPATLSSTQTATAPSLYVANLAGLTNVLFVTSSTFTGSGVAISLTASALSSSIGKGGGGSSGGAVASVNGKTGAVVINGFDTGVIQGPAAASSKYYTVQENIPTSNTVQTKVPYFFKTGTDSVSMLYGNAWGTPETCGPQMTLEASVEYPEGTFTPLFFNGKRQTTVDPCGLAYTDVLAKDFPAGVVGWVRTLIQKTNLTDSTVFGSSYNYGFSGNISQAGAPGQTNTHGFDGIEELNVGTKTDGTTTAASTTLTLPDGAFTGAYVGQTLAVGGAGPSGATLNTTIASVTNATTVVMANAATTAEAGTASVTISVTDKTLTGLVNVGPGQGYSAMVLLGRPTGIVQNACLVGDSITWGTGLTSFSTGSWAVQALNQAGVAAGRVPIVNVGIPYANMSQPSETIANFIVTHNTRFSVLGRCKKVLGMLGTNDLNLNATTAANLEPLFLTLLEQLQKRGVQSYYGTVVPTSTSTDGWITVAGQSTNASFAQRVLFNDWLRDGGPTDCTTLAPLATGTSSSNAARAAFYSVTGTLVNAASGPCVHPATAFFELADSVESSHNSGLWAADPNAFSVTDGAMTAGGGVLTSATANFTSGMVGRAVAVAGAFSSGQTLLATITGFTSATQVSVNTNAVLTVSGVKVTIDGGQGVTGGRIAFTDGIHPNPRGHTIMGAAAGLMVAGWTF